MIGYRWYGSMAVLLAAGSLSFAQPRLRANSESLDAFVVGVREATSTEFEVYDIRVGKQSLFLLFQRIRPANPAPIRPREDSLLLKVTRPSQVGVIQAALSAEHATSILVRLRHPAPSLVRRLLGKLDRGPWLFGPKYDIEIPIVPSRRPCAAVTRIVFRSINDLVRRRFEQVGQTRVAVSLNAIFTLLVNDSIQAFMSSLDPADRRSECVRTIELLEWIRGGTVNSFDSGKYRLEPRLRSVLDSVVGAIPWSRVMTPERRFRIEATGFTDSVEVKTEGIGLSLTESGLAAPEGDGVPDIRYRGCARDTLDGTAPVPVALDSSVGIRVRRRIHDNCELGAVRGYVVARYLEGTLRRRVEYAYASGGVSSAARTGAGNRKVEVVIVLQAAGERSSPPPRDVGRRP